MNPLNPDRLSRAERLAEVCRLLGLGLTRLIREWRGVEHAVTVLPEGYEWQGRPYRSLSAVARAITGTRWNGPVFFGIRNHRGAA